MEKTEPFQIFVSKLFGPYIKERRQMGRDYLNLNQRELAEKLGISAQFLGRIERGQVPIPDDLQEDIIVLLKIPLSVVKNIYVEASANKAKSMLKQVEIYRKKKKLTKKL